MNARQKDWACASVIVVVGLVLLTYIVWLPLPGTSQATQDQITSCRALGGQPVLRPLNGRAQPSWYLEECRLAGAQ